MIDEWRENWIRQVRSIARSAIDDPDQNITAIDLTYRLRELVNEFSQDENDASTIFGADDIERNFYFSDESESFSRNTSRRQSESSDLTSTVGQALVIKQKPRCIIKCYKDPAGVMAIGEDQLAYIDFVWNHEQVREMKMYVVSNIESNVQEPTADRTFDFPYTGEQVRVVDMDYWPTHNRYVLAVVQTGEQRASWHYLFNPSPNEGEEAFERWVNSLPGDTISRVCCTKEIVYEIVNHYRKGFVVLLNAYGVTRARKSALDLFPPDSDRYDSDILRLIDICCSPSNKKLAVSYNCCLGSQRGPVGIHVFDPTREWALLSRIDLGYTNVEYYMPRLLHLYKVDLLVALHVMSGNLFFYDNLGERKGKRSFILYVEEYEENQPHLYPVNICASQKWVAIRFNRYITIHRIND
ncbi:hypothetical protein I4U23_000183 [Adineta vaga]|nr:hypothetical protein I4U23_000183 [Adineta vaga]